MGNDLTISELSPVHAWLLIMVCSPAIKRNSFFSVFTLPDVYCYLHPINILAASAK